MVTWLEWSLRTELIVFLSLPLNLSMIASDPLKQKSNCS